MKYAMMIILLCFMLTGLCGCKKSPSFSYSAASSEMDEKVQAFSSENVTEDWNHTGEMLCLYVDVCGEVVSPGVYAMADGARVCDVIVAAGGFTEDAAKEAVNQARLLCDGEQIIVPSLADMEAGLESGYLLPVEDGLVNVNTAEATELMSLPGIGEAKAADIISYRTEHGRFQSIEELMQVPGIKEGLYQKLKDKIKVE